MPPPNTGINQTHNHYTIRLTFIQSAKPNDNYSSGNDTPQIRIIKLKQIMFLDYITL